MKRYKSTASRILLALMVVVPGLVCSGCAKAFDDNPVSADQMEQIRNKEANERANFNPNAAKPGAPAPAPK